MGKKGKVGKARKDRFYHLAKETGYRSRAAFKLIQLNRKFEFLQKSNVIVDLCAAPGGWLQVAAENAPMSNHIIGIDLVAINPIKGVTTLEEDITTERCRQALRKELHTAKADLFLNDGAPNVGTNWLNDAYQQVELTLYALKLATEFLRKGGWFVTKIFRSKDYDSLMWVFQQLFKNVHATKPQASRNESAEIFVVCQSFIAPDKIDPKFLNPKYVFKEVSEEKKMAIDLMRPTKRHRHREGYPEGDDTLYTSLPVTKFLTSPDYMNLLAQSSEMKFDSDEIENHPLTTIEIKECLKDIKVLGKSELKNIFKWRNKLKKALEESKPTLAVKESADSKPKKTEDGGEEDELAAEEKELAELEQWLEEKNMQQLREMKKAKKKVKKAQVKQKARIDAKMVIPGDRLDMEGDLSVFDMKKIKNKEQLSEVEGGDLSITDGADMFEEDSDDDEPSPKRLTFEKGEKKLYGTGEDSDEEEEMEEEPTFDDVDDEDEEDEEDNENDSNPLLVDMGTRELMLQDHQDSWFSKSVFEDLEREADEDIELGQMGMETDKKKRRREKAKKESAITDNLAMVDSDDEFSESDDSDVDDDEDDKEDEDDSGVDSRGQEESDDDEDDSSDDDDDDDTDDDYMEANSLKKKKGDDQKVTKFDGIEVVPAAPDPKLQLNEEGLAIGAAMMQSRKRKREIIESGYHRYMYDDVGLPDWFEKEEKKYTQRQMPISKGELEEYKLKSKAIDAAPIKKVAEAKARKKKRMLKSLEKARKKANAISDNVDVSEKEKWNQIKHVYKKAGLLKKANEKVTYVKAKKGAGKKVRRPAGVKGKFKVVDGRMKKDVKSQQKAEMRKQKNSTKRRKEHSAKANRRVRR